MEAWESTQFNFLCQSSFFYMNINYGKNFIYNPGNRTNQEDNKRQAMSFPFLFFSINSGLR